MVKTVLKNNVEEKTFWFNSNTRSVFLFTEDKYIDLRNGLILTAFDREN